ncbi:tetraacyldisaccharide 4'-kinase [Agarilytica rhodophyticola]|uniref:tetraacyldisaccharide 4'-kinase n=1 Tax=Agarilytica rhodophyticola TaxID=1737490 RepID=UPI00131A02D2|nr:tetraacyldisaccharide 4'-kinase [Agarilytica rhodophyticola]
MAKRFSLQAAVERRWYGQPGCLLLLSPLEKLFSSITQKRKRTHLQASSVYSCPVIVVGNISVGGTGKTPTIIALVKLLQNMGKKPGVISRGYGRKSDTLALVDDNSKAHEVGDEPLLIYRATACNVAVSSDRHEAIETLAKQHQCDIVLSDDGLQHYKMHRDKEIIVVDGERLFGNGHLLPVGPLREYPARLREASWVLVNMPSGSSFGDLENLQELSTAHAIRVKAKVLTDIVSAQQYPLSILQSCDNLVAFAGLGNPNKFFKTLDSLGFRYHKKPFPDHHHYCAEDFSGLENKTIIMTEKDAVKCRHLITGVAYSLAIEMVFPEAFIEQFRSAITKLLNNS